MENKKHAFLIIAHNEPEVLKILVTLLDDERNDIYIHVDKKSNLDFLTKDISVKFSHLFYVERYDVRWGDYSQIQVELELFQKSYIRGYAYYHLISGVDLPIKSIDKLYKFCLENNGKQFISMWDVPQKELIEKVLCYNFFTKNLKNKNIILRFICRLIHKIIVYFQLIFNIRRKTDMKLMKGSNWCSLTHDFVGYLLTKKDMVEKMFKYSCCGDEIFIQTILINSPFSNEVYSEGNLREINWKGGDSPRNWNKTDFFLIKNSKAFFARKFSYDSNEIINDVIDLCNI